MQTRKPAHVRTSCCLLASLSTRVCLNKSCTGFRDHVSSPGVDPCALGHECQHICIDTDDSYICRCRAGYVLNPDEKTCTRKNPDVSNVSGLFWVLVGCFILTSSFLIVSRDTGEEVWRRNNPRVLFIYYLF